MFVKNQRLRGQQLVRRYKKIYQIADEIDISEKMILKHWELEKRLAKQLRESTEDTRWNTFEKCYTELFLEIDWLNREIGTSDGTSPQKKYMVWPLLLGHDIEKIYEIGSGKGELINYLVNQGYTCKGTEITHERGKKHVPDHSRLSWGISDGVHFDQFEAKGNYDAVISNQVIEHIHPDDLLAHLQSVRLILADDGKYIFTTPHKFIGPSDISKVFKCDKPLGMHLKEYSYIEIRELLMKSDFKRVKAVWNIPGKINRILNIPFKPYCSCLLYSYLCAIERIISFIPYQFIRRKATLVSRFIFFTPSIFIVAEK